MSEKLVTRDRRDRLRQETLLNLLGKFQIAVDALAFEQ